MLDDLIPHGGREPGYLGQETHAERPGVAVGMVESESSGDAVRIAEVGRGEGFELFQGLVEPFGGDRADIVPDHQVPKFGRSIEKIGQLETDEATRPSVHR